MSDKITTFTTPVGDVGFAESDLQEWRPLFAALGADDLIGMLPDYAGRPSPLTGEPMRSLEGIYKAKLYESNLMLEMLTPVESDVVKVAEWGDPVDVANMPEPRQDVMEIIRGLQAKSARDDFQNVLGTISETARDDFQIEVKHEPNPNNARDDFQKAMKIITFLTGKPEQIKEEPAPVKEKKVLGTKSKKTDIQLTVIENARLEWKKAVEDRKKALAQWDLHVKTLHEKFIEVRG